MLVSRDQGGGAMPSPTVGEYWVRTTIDRPDPTEYQALRSYSTANISDALSKLQTLPQGIKPIYLGCPPLLGPAITVQVSPGDELLPLKAIEIAEPGDVIVIAGAYSSRFCIWGGVMSYMAKMRGIAGLVTDGLVRDVHQIRTTAFPVYAAGVTPAGTCRDVPPGLLNYPLAVGSAVVNPGDLIAADEDGVVCVPRDQISTIDASVREKLAREDQWMRTIQETRQMVFKDEVDQILAERRTHYLKR